MTATNYTFNNFFTDNMASFSNNTVEAYKTALKQFFSFCKKNFDSVQRKDIQFWIRNLFESGLKPNSVLLKKAAISSFYQYCIEEELIAKDPTLFINAPGRAEPEIAYLDKTELALIRELAANNVRDRVIIETLFTTGVRVSELTNIHLSDIKWETKQIWVRKGKGKSERYVLTTSECLARIKNYLANRKIDSPYLFCNRYGNKLSRHWVAQIFQKYSERMGQRVTPHTMRHTFACFLIEKGMPLRYVQYLLGHKDINSTRRYTRLSVEALKRLYDRIN